ncbi:MULTISPECIES: tyrosine-type recombinase/integrase [unclassified Acinetobacter]|uniref:tyrosine-type recombinase/integrase n=1 Tax=unclassified Acinetobacter TaxID=196816 RepID=UPI00244D73F3|nr:MULTISPECIES: tyrosine-type recombinase/integrase [unclassified Acinetobacter]MDH0030939.1 tyrosine-type recombinase/integrase [Acinetobacter sp. GD04021]MDH0886511.1 tyrosine-type recombinase/integrase [Acinetobacter sp. GD03873]MDH1083051.1 tyrosine-type recombinase/integrase [Acinetobacter sp. GD03983]MDH2189988.1 tyrosine-type recombinase/integrase [Acinetobacter sp. GD03645]MDH2203230.1 tyrosine-type recombinase/integrase [Acinetobacter sp. GD03647]
MKKADIKKFPMQDTTLSSLESELKEYRVNDGENLHFVVHPKGNKRWELRYKKPSNLKWTYMGLGAYPEVSGKLARQKAAEARRLLADGIDPKEHRDQEKQALLNSDQFSFKSLAVEYCNSKTWVKGTRTRNEGALRNHVYPLMGNRDYRKITKKEWLDLIQATQKKLHPTKGTPIVKMGERVRGLCKDIYDLAEVTGRIDQNPLSGIEKFIEKSAEKNMEHVTIDELPKLLVDIRAYPSRVTSIGLQLLSMLACRPTELREAVWSEFNLDKELWVIPSERMKKRIEHIIPLPTQAITLLNELKSYCGSSAYLFKSRSNSSKPVSNNTFNKALKSLGYQGKQTPHGFRHIFSTQLRELGFTRDHVEAALAHKVGGVEGIYNKAIYIEPRKVMIQKWADYLDGLVDAEMKREIA